MQYTLTIDTLQIAFARLDTLIDWLDALLGYQDAWDIVRDVQSIGSYIGMQRGIVVTVTRILH